MRQFRSHQNKPGLFRWHLHFGLPDNPICWLFGHRAVVTIVEPKYIEPYRMVRCRWCDRQHHSTLAPTVLEDRMTALVADGLPPHEARRQAGLQLQAEQVATIRELGAKQVAASIEGRDPGWSSHERDESINIEAVFYPKYYAKRWAEGPRARLGMIGDNLGFRFHTGGRGSETPVDAAVHFGLGSVYLSTSLFGRFTEWVGRGHKRELSVKTHDGSLWWQVWYDDDGGNDSYHRCDSRRRPRLWPWSAGRRKHRGWMCLRNGNLELNPADAVWGRASFHREALESPIVVAVPVGEFPGDTYPVELTLEREQLFREHGPAFARRVLSDRFTVSWDARDYCKGIPVRNHDWKGDEVLASGVSLPDGYDPADGRWPELAVEQIVEQVKRDRRHFGYVPPRTPAVG